MLRRAFDLGITHFDLANNYSPPYGSAERNFGKIMDLHPPAPAALGPAGDGQKPGLEEGTAVTGKAA